MAFCDQCGTPVASGAKFCQRCGHQVHGDNPEQPTTLSTPSMTTPQEETLHATPVPSTLAPARYDGITNAATTNRPALSWTPTAVPAPVSRPINPNRRNLIIGGVLGGVALLVGVCILVSVLAARGNGGVNGITNAGKVEFGTGYSQANNGFTIVSPKTVFSSSDSFAYVAHASQQPGTTSIDVLLTNVSSGGETVVSRSPMNIADPRYTEFANSLPVYRLMGGQAPGTYKLKFVTGSTILAEGTFTYR